jgi:hypothetical protein
MRMEAEERTLAVRRRFTVKVYAHDPMVVLGSSAVSCEQGTPVIMAVSGQRTLAVRRRFTVKVRPVTIISINQ